MGAILLNGSEIGENSLVGAGALITEGKFKKNAKSYYNLMKEYKLR
jgi:carbonic anhydrase/acetyltransferase-like protein (isoleucine patch superfamily)